jgi:protein-tyrosine phosphatase
MDQILPHRLWIGHAGDSRNYPHLLEIGIEAIIQVAIEELPLQPPRELVYMRFPLADGGGCQAELINLAITAVASLIVSGVPTLISCAAGMSRSPAIAAAALAVANRSTPELSLREVARYRRADVSPGLWSAILEVLSSRSDGCETAETRNP